MVFSTHKISRVTGLKTLSGGYEMTVQLPGGAINLLAVHPTSPTQNVEGWRADHQTILHAAEAAQGATVLAGDFNATMDHAPVRTLLGDGFSDAATQAKSRWQPTWPASDKVMLLGIPLPSMLQLDHVFVDDHLRAVHTDTVSIDGTDHRALIARLVQR
jgi:endonuclease/exonuclease/phosphatase (EEP) superfamily protein YafD